MIFQKNQRFFKLPKLRTPTISVTKGTIVHISNFESNGDFVQGWELYNADTGSLIMSQDISETSYDMVGDLHKLGDHKFYAKVTGENFIRSDASNVIVITV